MAKLTQWLWFAVVALFTSAALAQSPEPRGRVLFAQPELDQMLAPIALYPDSLLSQILMAATYPRDVAEAASWSRASRLSGDQAVRAVEREPWDASVISLVAFPEVLAMMDERMDWTERLGDAFIAQEDEVMDTVQDLRRRADAAGSLRSSEEMVVQRQGYDYVIEPPEPDVVYVPYYDPNLVYGTWWWPQYQPIYWRPWSGYRYRAGYRGFGWGYGIRLGHGFFFGAFDWARRDLRYASHRPWYHHADYRGGTRWTPRWDHRRGDRNVQWRGRDGRTDRQDRREGRGERRVQSPAPAPATAAAQGFFPPRVESAPAQVAAPAAARNPAMRAASPRYNPEGVARSEGRRQQPQVREYPQPQGSQQRVVPQQYVAPQQRVVPQQYVTPQQRGVPQAVAPSHSPVERPATSRAPAVRSAPVERPEPAERSAASRSSDTPSPVGRGSRGGGRER